MALNTPGALLRHLDFEHGPRRINAEASFFSVPTTISARLTDCDVASVALDMSMGRMWLYRDLEGRLSPTY